MRSQEEFAKDVTEATVVWLFGELSELSKAECESIKALDFVCLLAAKYELHEVIDFIKTTVREHREGTLQC